MAKKEHQGLKSTAVRSEATCPRCGKVHFICIFYTGKLPIRKFCKQCKLLSDYTFNQQGEYKIAIDNKKGV